MRRVFPYVAVVAPKAALDGTVGSNFVVLASASPLPLAQLRAQLEALDVLNQRQTATTVLDGQSLVDYIGGAMVLTDDFAPVDQLLTTAR